MDASHSTPNGSVEVLSKLLGGDPRRIIRVLRAFRDAAGQDLFQLDQAVRDGDVSRLRGIAHRVAMMCHLVGEAETGRLLEATTEAVATEVIDPILMKQIARARRGLIDAISRASLYVEQQTSDAPDGETEPPQ